MNLLAHAYLGFDDPELIAGQVAGDFVKGRDLSDYPEAIAHGIRMHRNLDAWTDRHPVFRRSCERFPRARRRVAGIVVDLVYDHSLARQWSFFCHTDLVEYAGFLYSNLEASEPDLPDRMKRFIRRSPQVGLFEGYRETEGLERAIRFVASRMKRSELFDGVLEEVGELLPQLDTDFAEFFPAAIRHAITLTPKPEQLRIFGDRQSSAPKIEVFLP